MFGYVIPNHTALSPEAQARYRTAYCGLCRRIDALHGLRGRFTLSYDLTFLDLLLCSLYEGESELSTGCSRCPVHPLHGVNWRSSGPTDYCADLSVALHYYNAEDKWKDDHNLLGLGYEKLLSGCRTDAEARWPRQCAAIRSCLARLAEYEAAGSEDLDTVSGCFGELIVRLQAGPLVAGAAQPGLPSGQVHLSDGRLRRSGPRQAEGRLQSPQNHERAARLRGRDAGNF